MGDVVVDMTGQVCGRLTVIKRAEPPPWMTAGPAYWECLCSCGETAIVSGPSLRNGTKSCGCLQRETRTALNVLKKRRSSDL